MIKGIGIDVVDIQRIEAATNRWRDRFLNKVFTREELSSLPIPPRRWEYLAGRFAAKEAFFKALGTGLGKGLSFCDAWVVNHDSGRPEMMISKKAGGVLKKREIGSIHLSISHEKGVAVAVVVLES